MGALISQNIQYGGATLSQQSTPIGAIIPYMGTTAPNGYLTCDGGVYSISLYPLLAGFFETQFGSINYFGGDGTTTFAVPNLQGEFLRGAGTNSHSNQGSGGTVGQHQDGTEIPDLIIHTNGQLYTARLNSTTNNTNKNYDSKVMGIAGTNYVENHAPNGDAANSYTQTLRITSRPTNTSVLYIIKAKSDRLDKITFAEVNDASEADDVVWSAEKIANLTPIGKVDAFFRNTAPYGYLKCDGSIYNIADYPLLAALFNSEFGSANVYGGDGTTTFAVPNLQGEFIRGAGANSHSNQGSGGSVGEHQDGTLHVECLSYSSGLAIAERTSDTKHDSEPISIPYHNISGASAAISGSNNYTSRPTNTSVLYCISAYR